MPLTRVTSGVITSNAITTDKIAPGAVNASSISSLATLSAVSLSASQLTVSSINYSDRSIQSTASYTGFRNRIINGAMQIDQRNAGAHINSTAEAIYTLDRWNYNNQVSSKYRIGQNLNNIAPVPGFTNYLGVSSTSAYTVQRGEAFLIEQRLEGYALSDLSYGTPHAQPLALSFWVRSSIAGLFGAAIQLNLENGSFASYGIEYTVNNINTWEYKTATIPGNTLVVPKSANQLAMILRWSMGTGAPSLSAGGTWSSAGIITGITGQQNIVGTNGATWYIAGVQLEKGSEATPFEYRPYGTELALCQRYYWRMSSNAAITFFFQGYMYSTSQLEGLVPFPVPMRAQPSIGYSPVSQFSLRLTGNAITGLFPYSTADEFVPYTQILLYTFNAAVASVGYAQSLISNSATATFIEFRSEL